MTKLRFQYQLHKTIRIGEEERKEELTNDLRIIEVEMIRFELIRFGQVGKKKLISV